MQTFTTAELRAALAGPRREGRGIGLVPTMGALHAGHLALVRRARAECDVVVASVFVNPTQFAAGEDFGRYPRDLDADAALLEREGVDALFAPTAAEVYPPGDATVVEVPALAERWEGAARPGHFRGVATVCAKLFGIVGPERAYFGEKDYQQLQIIQRMVTDLFLPLTVVPVPTVREPDGLAMSSRNRYLSPDERRAATALSRALRAAQDAFAGGERDARALEAAMRRVMEAEPLAALDYAAVVDPATLAPAPAAAAGARALIAARVGTTRLIDNAPVGGPRLPGDRE